MHCIKTPLVVYLTWQTCNLDLVEESGYPNTVFLPEYEGLSSESVCQLHADKIITYIFIILTCKGTSGYWHQIFL